MEIKQSDIMVISASIVDKLDRDNGTINSSEFSLLKNILVKGMSIDLTDIHFTSIIKYEISGKEPRTEELLAWTPKMREEILAVNPKIIITLGDLAMYELTGNTGITKLRGKVINYTNSIQLLPIYSSTYTQRLMKKDKSALYKYADDINKAFQLSLGEEVINEKATKCKICTTIEEVHELIAHSKATGMICLDFETEGLDRRVHKPTVLGISFQMGSGWVIPLYHFETPFTESEIHSIMDLLKVEVWENPNIRKVGWNFKFDLHFANTYTPGGINPVNVEDGINMHHLLDENVLHSIKIVGPQYFEDFQGWEDEVKKYKWDSVPLSILAPYCVIDTDLALRLCVYFESQLMDIPELYNLYRNLMNPSMIWTFNAEKKGMHIDKKFLNDSIKGVTELIDNTEKLLRDYPEVISYDEYKRKTEDRNLVQSLSEKMNRAIEKRNGKEGTTKTIENYKQRIRDIKSGILDKDTHKEINFASGKQLGELMYNDEGFGFSLPYVKKKRGLHPSTAKEHLEELGDDTGFVSNLIEWKRMKKLLSTYFVGINDRLYSDDTLHCEFLIYGTVTGRFCVSGDTDILTNKGLIPIKDLCPSAEGYREVTEPIYAKTHTGNYKPIEYAHNKGIEVMYDIELEDGKTLRCTENHKFLTNKGWTNLKFLLSLSPEHSKEYKIISYDSE